MAEIDPEERESILEDLEDLEAMRSIFSDRYKGVVIACTECGEDHYYYWDMLKESLQYMLDTGEPRMHEPAYEPHPDDYVGWDYARGFIDALMESDAEEMEAPPGEEAPPPSVWLSDDRTRCAYCRGRLPQRGLAAWTYCPFCGASLAPLRLVDALAERGWSEQDITGLMDQCGFEPPLGPGEEPE